MRKKEFDEKISFYFDKIKPFQNSNLTLLDAWTYANGNLYGNDLGPLVNYFDKTPIEALMNCMQYQSKENCLLMEKFTKELGTDNIDYWKLLQEKLYEGLIPLCSYATKDAVIKKCTAFKRTVSGQCFSFNESIIPRLGLTQGLNFLVNYDYPGTSTELNQPIYISLHQPNKQPDIKKHPRQKFLCPTWSYTGSKNFSNRH